MVRFSDTVLQRCYQRITDGTRKWGEKTARRYIQRINILYAVKAANELSSFPQLRFHPLKGDRQGEYALDLDNVWRLVVSFDDDGMTIVTVEEVSKHYGD